MDIAYGDVILRGWDYDEGRVDVDDLDGSVRVRSGR